MEERAGRSVKKTETGSSIGKRSNARAEASAAVRKQVPCGRSFVCQLLQKSELLSTINLILL